MRAFALIILFALSALHCAENHIELGPSLGYVGPSEAHVWLKARAAAKVTLVVWPAADPAAAQNFEGPALSAESEFMGRAAARNLKPATKYAYRIELDGKAATLPPYPEFSTAPEAGSPGKLRFAFISCLGRDPHSAAAAWGDMLSRAKFDLLLMLGDNHYADSTDPAVQRTHYYAHRASPAYQFLSARVPVLGIWDDHDYGPNDSDGSAAGKERSLQTFKEFWANPAYGEEGNPGCYFSFRHGGVEFFMLDNRYHRSPNSAPNDEKKTMLGARQLEWLKEGLKKSTAPVKIVASGSEWQTFGHKDSWTSFDRERRSIWSFIDDNKIPGVLFLSGDRHFSGAYQIQQRFIEVTSGPFGSRNFPTKNLPEMFINHGRGKLYCIFEVDTAREKPAATLEIYRAGEGLIEKRAFTYEEINGQVKIPPLPAGEAGKQ
jgi:alkaline phosphatase D